MNRKLDAVALALPVIVAAMVVAVLFFALVRGRWMPVLTAASWALFGIVAVVGPWIPQRSDRPADAVRVVAANTFGNSSFTPSIAADLSAQNADILVISEIGFDLDDLLADQYATVVRAQGATRPGGGDVSLYTDLPATDLGLPAGLRGQSGVRVQIDGPAGEFVLYGMHLPPPRLTPAKPPEVSVTEHSRIVEALRKSIAAERLPVVLAGDLNLVDRAAGYRRMTALLDDAIRDGWGRPTALRGAAIPLLARIDHVFMPDGWCSADASIYALTSSDHRGVSVAIGPCP